MSILDHNAAVQQLTMYAIRSKFEVYGGAFLIVFGLFMLSLAEKDSFYQVGQSASCVLI